MKILLNERNLVVGIGSHIEYGIWGNISNLPSWRITPTYYRMDDNFTVLDVGALEIPTYVKEDQYYFIDGQFKLADECPNEYKDRIVTAEESIGVIEDAMCDTELLTDERIAAIEDAICELSMLLSTLTEKTVEKE